MPTKTISEVLFERFCESNDLPFRRIEESTEPGEQSPDYEVTIDDFGPLIAEVKQFDPTDEHRKLVRQFQDRKYTDAYGREPGSRARLKIQAGVKQLKARGRGSFRTLLVLYDNLPIPTRVTDPYEIRTAMYGITPVQDSFS